MRVANYSCVASVMKATSRTLRPQIRPCFRCSCSDKSFTIDGLISLEEKDTIVYQSFQPLVPQCRAMPARMRCTSPLCIATHTHTRGMSTVLNNHWKLECIYTQEAGS